MAEQLIDVREGRRRYEVFDADNHLCGTRDAPSTFLLNAYQGAIKYVDVNVRTQLVIRDKVGEHVPNPTFAQVVVAGGWGRGQGKGAVTYGVKPEVMPGIHVFRGPEARVASMKDIGTERTLPWSKRSGRFSPTVISAAGSPLVGRVAADSAAARTPGA